MHFFTIINLISTQSSLRAFVLGNIDRLRHAVDRTPSAVGLSLLPARRVDMELTVPDSHMTLTAALTHFNRHLQTCFLSRY